MCRKQRDEHQHLAQDRRAYSDTLETMARISIIVAVGKDNVIGKDNDLLWRLPDDLKRFKALTVGNPVIMGRKTWESLPEKFRPLPDRTNIVVTRDPEYLAEGALIAHSLPEALRLATRSEGLGEVFVIGGGELYRQALPLANRLYVTEVADDSTGTVFFPDYTEFSTVIEEDAHEENGVRYIWRTLER